MHLDVESSTRVENPNAADVAREVTRLSFPTRKFARLEEGDLFVQAYRNEDGTLTLEHSEGSVDRMFNFEPASDEQAVEVMRLFLEGGDYRSAVPFEHFTL